MGKNIGWAIVLMLILAVVVISMTAPKKEGLSGFGVTSGLALNNRTSVCSPGQQYPGAAYSGGCVIPHRVIF